jgi:gliding motility-associated lipoprotein GldK
MKKVGIALLGIFGVLVLFSSCGSSGDGGQLTGVLERPKWNGINPYGMVYIPSGQLHIGQSDQDIFNSHIQRTRSISISGFFMDDTEITNNEYRQFVNWVKDSLGHVMMEDYIEDDFGNEKIDWDLELDWSDELLDDLFYQGEEAFNGREFDVRKLIYEYSWEDWKKIANSDFNDRLAHINKETAQIYPDTLCWIRDFAYSYNEPFARNYFWHPSFDDYPVVGIDWKKANAFTHWRSKFWDDNRPEEVHTEAFRLPTEYEWEYAARGGHDLAPYPWGGYYVRNAKGCLLANFKPGRGNYPEDGGQYTVRADAYFPNDYGLYNMAGNVSEWTITAYFDNANNVVHDMNPDIRYDAAVDDPPTYKRKVIRGGSWKDVYYYLQTGTRSWEYQDTNKSYIGFRCALTFLGRSINDFK